MASDTRYVSNGQVLTSPPLGAQIRAFGDNAIQFFGLYLTTLVSLDAWASAESSPFSLGNNSRLRGSSNNNGGGGGGGGGGPGGGGKKLGRVDDVRGPECKSCK